MRYLLFVDLVGFYVREWMIREPERADQPMAVHRDKRVIDLNPSASLLGLRSGMRLDEAKLLLTGAGLILYEPEPYRASQAKWLDTLSEFSSVVEPCEPHSAWADLSGHPDPYELIGQIVSKLHRSSGLNVRWGLSSAKWVARRASDLREELPFSAMDWVERPAMGLASLPVGKLDPIDPAHRERLKFLGYRTIGSVAALSLKTLKSQFGEAAMGIHLAANGKDRSPVLAQYPPDAICLKRCFEAGLTDLQELGTALEELARATAFALSQRASQGAKMEIRIELETRYVDRRRTFSRPIRTAQEALSALSRLVGEPSETLFSIAIKMPSLRKAAERQAGLFASRIPGDDVAAKRAVERVRDVFGDRSVMRASELVEPRRVRVLRAWSHATGWK